MLVSKHLITVDFGEVIIISTPDDKVKEVHVKVG